jgi:hypothetical protein
MVEKLTIISILTTVSTEALKKILDEIGFRYASNIVAIILSTIISAVVVFYPAIKAGFAVDLSTILELIALAFFSFLGATLGYDKMLQTVKQIKE